MTRSAVLGLALAAVVASVPACGAGPAPRTTAGPPTSSRGRPDTSSAGRPTAACVPVRATPLAPGEHLEEGRGGVWAVVTSNRLVEALQVEPAAARLHVEQGALCGDRPLRVIRSTGTLVEQATWRDRGGTRSLSVRPGWAARAWPGATEALVVELGEHVPEIRAPGMVDQLRCHVAFAPDKAVWHLEPGRPEVGYPATVAARCNPGEQRDADGL